MATKKPAKKPAKKPVINPAQFPAIGSYVILRDFTADKFVGRVVDGPSDRLTLDHVTWIASSEVRDHVLMASGPSAQTEAEAYPVDQRTSWPIDAIRISEWAHGPVTTR